LLFSTPKRQKKFTDLSGAAEAQGDLSSIVLHSLNVKHSRSSFPIALGVRATGVDDATYSSTGEAFSTIRKFSFHFNALLFALSNVLRDQSQFDVRACLQFSPSPSRRARGSSRRTMSPSVNLRIRPLDDEPAVY
jgi:hypothetical protein